MTATCDDLARFLKVHRGAATVLLGSLPVVQRSRLARDLAHVLSSAGLADADVAATTLVIEAAVSAFIEPPVAGGRGGQLMTLAIDSGSWRVLVRAAAPDTVDVATSTGGGGAASVEMRPGNLVLVKNRRGGDHGAVELSPNYTWYFKVHGGTWNTVLDLSGLRISGIELDSGAGNVTCTPARADRCGADSDQQRHRGRHPPPPSHHGGARCSVAGVGARAPRRQADPPHVGRPVGHPGRPEAANRYDLTVYSGCVRVTMDTDAPAVPEAAPAGNVASGDASIWRSDLGISLVLDGIEKRLSDRRAD